MLRRSFVCRECGGYKTRKGKEARATYAALRAPGACADRWRWPSEADHIELAHMFDLTSSTDFDCAVRNVMRDADPVLRLARARQQVLAAWGEAQEEADHIRAALAPEARGDPEMEEISGYTAALERSMRLFDPLLEIETQIEETTATTLAGLLIQARLLEEGLALSHRGGSRLLSSIIAGLEEMTEPADGG